MAVRPLAAVALALVLLAFIGPRDASARDCRDETPLPPDVRLIAPGADVPADVARFAGAWVGPWTGLLTGDRSCGSLVVEEVLPSGHARVIYSRGAWEPLKIKFPRYWRATGRIVDGSLEFALPTFDRPPMVYKFTNAMSFDLEGLILAGEAIRPLCRPAVAAITAPPPAPLTADAVRRALTDQTFASAVGRNTFYGSGAVVGESGERFDVGRWEITADGQYCRTWNVWDRGRRRCYRVHATTDGLEFQPVDRWDVVRLRRATRSRQGIGRGAVLRNTTSDSVAATITLVAVTKIARYDPVTS